MSTYAECLAALPEFRNELHRKRSEAQAEAVAAFNAPGAFAVHGAFAAFATPFSNVHATGVGIRSKGGEYTNEVVIKVYVFDKVSMPADDAGVLGPWKGVPVDVEQLPIQLVRGPQDQVSSAAAVMAPQALTPEQQRRRPVVGGISISPLNADFIGTLGCFLRRKTATADQMFALSNNHVLADVDNLPMGTPIVQPGPEVAQTKPADVFAKLEFAIPIHFPTGPNDPTLNRFDAAIARITDSSLIQLKQTLGLPREGLPGCDPSAIATPEPNMRVMKVGRTSGFTRGVITATNVQGTQVNYGSQQSPRLAVYRDTIEIVGDNGPFSRPGDSGSVILEESTGHPVALLFAGDGKTTTACDFGQLCQQLNVLPA
jgi:hypothetical protein